MEKPISLDLLFKNKIFRIPDYQRGYAWQHAQLKSFWEDLINLQSARSHYTGVLTLTEINKSEIPVDAKEYWLVSDHSYRVYNVVDGQQRLSTFVIFIQALADFFRHMPENSDIAADEIYITDSLTLADLEKTYLFKSNRKGGFKTYKFGYTEDNPSQEYLRHRILGEPGGGNIQETFYTLNLEYAKNYFVKVIGEHQAKFGKAGLSELYRKLTQRFLFNEYIIEDEFDVFVAFETMNNRGKKLSDLELLKNRLIYLTTLFNEEQLDTAGKKVLRDDINAAWKNVYHQLGRNKLHPLNDDEFLRAHWITYFKYSRDTGRDYADFLINEHFLPQRILSCDQEVLPETVQDQSLATEQDEQDDNDEPAAKVELDPKRKLNHSEIRNFVMSLNDSAVHWYNSHNPALASNMAHEEVLAIDRLNRIGIGYFRPLVMVVLMKVMSERERIDFFNKIEHYQFLAFRLGNAKSNYRSSEFYNFARTLAEGKTSLKEISDKFVKNLEYTYNSDSTLRIDDFYSTLHKKFSNGSGYYGWSGIRYVLFEYEQSLLHESRQSKVEWADFLKPGKDRISIEHIYPQTPTEEWEDAFASVPEDERINYSGTIGNLLLLSASINSSLQNDSFVKKKNTRSDSSGKKIKNGYADGSHSEIEVADNDSWGPTEIRERSIRILKFMEKRWNFKLSDADREKLLFI